MATWGVSLNAGAVPTTANGEGVLDAPCRGCRLLTCSRRPDSSYDFDRDGDDHSGRFFSLRIFRNSRGRPMGRGQLEHGLDTDQAGSSNCRYYVRHSWPVVRDDRWQFRFQSLGPGPRCASSPMCARTTTSSRTTSCLDDSTLCWSRIADFFAFYRPWYDAFGTLKNHGRQRPNTDVIQYSSTSRRPEPRRCRTNTSRTICGNIIRR